MGDGYRWPYRSRCALGRSARERGSTRRWGARGGEDHFLRASIDGVDGECARQVLGHPGLLVRGCRSQLAGQLWQRGQHFHGMVLVSLEPFPECLAVGEHGQLLE